MAESGTWAKPDPADVERFYAALPDHPAAERKKMFGYPACFVNGHFFAGLYGKGMVIRLPGGIRDGFSELAGSPTFDPMGTGKGMKDWYGRCWAGAAIAASRSSTTIRTLSIRRTVMSLATPTPSRRSCATSRRSSAGAEAPG